MCRLILGIVYNVFHSIVHVIHSTLFYLLLYSLFIATFTLTPFNFIQFTLSPSLFFSVFLFLLFCLYVYPCDGFIKKQVFEYKCIRMLCVFLYEFISALIFHSLYECFVFCCVFTTCLLCTFSSLNIFLILSGSQIAHTITHTNTYVVFSKICLTNRISSTCVFVLYYCVHSN